MRGKLQPIVIDKDGVRITPAGAGKTVYVALKAVQQGDHPRRCGENCTRVYPLEGGAGSPPQVRGKPTHLQRAAAARRITPAGAGKTMKTDAKPLAGQDHPRRCGENDADAKSTEGRMRITPAGAGKTKCWKFLLDDNTDHPRRCGENTKKIL